MYLTQGLRRAQQIRPKGCSTVFRDRRRTWTQTAERVRRIAGGLAATGVRSGDRVAILALNSDRYYELMYAIPWLGAAMVPVNTRLAAPEIQYILEDAGACALFIDGAMKGHLPLLAVAQYRVQLHSERHDYRTNPTSGIERCGIPRCGA